LKQLKRKSNRWWTEDLSCAWKNLRNLCKKFKRNEITQITLKDAQNDYKSMISDAKQKSWEEFLSKIENAKETGSLMRMLGKKSSIEIGLLKKSDGNFCETPYESLGELMKKHFPDSKSFVEPPTGEWNSNDNNCEIRITKDIVKKIMKQSFKKNKAGGPDKFKPHILQELPDNAFSLLAKIYRACLTNKYTPKRWREMETIFIPKPGKDKYDIPGSFRPITLSSFMLKCLEKIIKNNWRETFMTEPFLNQHGFTEGRSCETALSTMVDKIEQAINKKGHICAAIFLDIQGAFDNVQFESIERELKNRGANNQTIEWYCNLLKTRKITTKLKGETYEIQPTRGAPKVIPYLTAFGILFTNP